MPKEFIGVPDRTQPVGFSIDEPERFAAEPFLHNALRVLRRRKLAAIIALLIFTVPAAVFVVMRPPVYQATARLLVERNDELKSVMKDPAAVGAPADTFFQTQQQFLRSRPVAVKTIQDMKLWETKQFHAELGSQPTSEEVARSGLVDRFLAHLFVVPTAGTHLLNVTFEASDPSLAMKAVNALTAVYIKELAASRGEDSSKLSGWINEKLAEQQRRLAASEAALQRYIATHDAVSVQDRQNIVVQKLSDLNTALTRAKTERMAKEAVYRQLEAAQADPSGIDALPVVLSNSVLQQLRSQLAEMKQKELRMGQDLGDRHPDLIKLRSEITLIEKRLDGELAKLTASVKNDFIAAAAIENDLNKALDEQKREVVGLNQKSLDYGALERQAASDRQTYERLLTEAQTQGITGNAGGPTVRVVDAAEQPLAPIGPHNTRDLGLVFAVGLLLAIGAPLGLETLDHRIKTPADIEQRLRLSCIAMVPQLPSKDSKRPLMSNEASGYNEAFRRIRTAITRPNKLQLASRVLVTSAIPNEGKSLVSANLAVAFAKAGKSVLLVDADLRRPTVHTNFDLTVGPGLTDLLLRQDGDLEASLRATTIPNLFVLTSGTPHADAAELLSSPSLATLLERLETRFNWIVFDSPPVGPVADACILARFASNTIFVVAAGTTTSAAVLAAIDQLKSADATIDGVVLNRVDLERSAYYYSPYHHSQYSAYYTAHTSGAPIVMPVAARLDGAAAARRPVAAEVAPLARKTRQVLWGALAKLGPSSRRKVLIGTAAVVGVSGMLFFVAMRPAGSDAPTKSIAETGTLTVDTRPPGAAVIIDGTARGVTPLSISLPPGTHTMTVRSQASERVMPLTINAGADVARFFEFANVPGGKGRMPSTTKAAKLPASVEAERAAKLASTMTTPAAGWLSVRAAFDVQLVEGADVIGSGDLSKIMLPAGRHEIELVNRALDFRESRNVVVESGKVTSLQVEAPQATVSANATPWADVTIDGKSVGQTPIANLPLPIGTHTFVFSHPKLGEKRQDLTVTANGPNRISMDLTQ